MIRQSTSDLELIRQSQSGEQEAFRLLVERYEGQVAATVIGMLGYGAEAEDVGQEVFIRFYRSLDKFRGESALGTYLTRIAINLSLNALKKRKRQQWFSLFSSKEDAPEMQLPDHGLTQDQKKYSGTGPNRLTTDRSSISGSAGLAPSGRLFDQGNRRFAGIASRNRAVPFESGPKEIERGTAPNGRSIITHSTVQEYEYSSFVSTIAPIAGRSSITRGTTAAGSGLGGRCRIGKLENPSTGDARIGSGPPIPVCALFAAKVLQKLSPEAIQESAWWQDMVFAFQRISMPAMAIVLILMAVVMFSEQSLSLDAITGIADLSMDDFWTESYYNELGS